MGDAPIGRPWGTAASNIRRNGGEPKPKVQDVRRPSQEAGGRGDPPTWRSGYDAYDENGSSDEDTGGYVLPTTTGQDGRRLRRLSSLSKPAAQRAVSSSGNSDVPVEDMRELEDVLASIDKEWSFLNDEDCNMVETALAFLDTSSVGRAREYPKFLAVTGKLEDSLQGLVNEHYQGFNTSVGSISSIMQTIKASQKRINQLKESLVAARSDLTVRKPRMIELSASSEKYKHMLELLDTIDQLREMPEAIESKMSSKQFLSAVNSLNQALRISRKEDIIAINGLQDIRLNLKNQENDIVDILLDELQNHLYLKSPYSNSRWTAYSAGKYLLQIENLCKGLVAVSSRDEISAKKLGLDEPLVEDTSENPESNSFRYFRIILESLAVLGKLPVTQRQLFQRLTAEIYQLINKTIEEVDSRYPRGFGAREENYDSSNPFRQLNTLETDVRVVILKDFIWTLYSKLEAVIKGYCVLKEIAVHIERRDNPHNAMEIASLFDLKEVWTIIENELNVILTDYLRSASKASASRDAVSINARLLSKDTAAGPKGPIFTFSKVAVEDAKLKASLEDIHSIFQTAVPGLVIDREVTPKQIQTPTDKVVIRHRHLVNPSAFNIRILFTPTVIFLRTIQVYLPESSNEVANKFLPEFLQRVISNCCLPELRKSIQLLYEEATDDPNAFIIDPQWRRSSSESPIFKSTLSIFNLASQLSRLLCNLSAFRKEFGDLIISSLESYARKCEDFYQELATTSESDDTGQITNKSKISSIWARTSGLVEIMDKGYLEGNYDLNAENEQEWNLAVEGSKIPADDTSKANNVRVRIARDDLLDHVSFEAICCLRTSLTWLSNELGGIAMVADNENIGDGQVDDDDSPTSVKSPGGSEKLSLARLARLAALDAMYDSNGRSGIASAGDGAQNVSRIATAANNSNASNNGNVGGTTSNSFSADDGARYLVITPEGNERLNKLLSRFDNLSRTCLYTVRSEIRCRVVYNLEGSLQEGGYLLEQPAQGPDNHVEALDDDLISTDDRISRLLKGHEKIFCKKGLASFMDYILIKGASQLRVINEHGVNKMYANILSLQQTLKTIVEDPSECLFESSSQYYRLLKLGPTMALKNIKQDNLGLSYDDFKVLLELLYSDSFRKATRRDTEVNLRKSLNENLIQLQEVMWNNE